MGQEPKQRSIKIGRLELVITLKNPYTRPLVSAFFLQVALLFFFSLILDLDDVALQACCFSSVAFWMGVILILIRRPRSPTKGDLIYICWGLLPIVLVGVPAFIWVWELKRVI